jgi:hypothetical protein
MDTKCLSRFYVKKHHLASVGDNLIIDRLAREIEIYKCYLFNGYLFLG